MMTAGAIIQADDGDAMVYFVRDGFKHWIMHEKWLSDSGFRWPNDLAKVPKRVVDEFLNGRPLGPRCSVVEWRNPPRRSSLEMRSVATSQLRGYGVEFGAGTSPMPVPLDCEVAYADMFTTEQLKAMAYPGQRESDFVPVSIIAGLDDLSSIDDDTLDFLVACHVIEHTRNPIGAIANAYRKLKAGGSLVLVIPDKNRTFDKKRPLTELSHLIQDFENPSRERDFGHFQEFYQLAFEVDESEYENVVQRKFDEAFPIHYHTWTHESFLEMVKYIGKNIVRWKDIWSQPTLDDGELDIEFYFVLTK